MDPPKKKKKASSLKGDFFAFQDDTFGFPKKKRKTSKTKRTKNQEGSSESKTDANLNLLSPKKNSNRRSTRKSETTEHTPAGPQIVDIDEKSDAIDKNNDTDNECVTPPPIIEHEMPLFDYDLTKEVSTTPIPVEAEPDVPKIIDPYKSVKCLVSITNQMHYFENSTVDLMVKCGTSFGKIMDTALKQLSSDLDSFKKYQPTLVLNNEHEIKRHLKVSSLITSNLLSPQASDNDVLKLSLTLMSSQQYELMNLQREMRLQTLSSKNDLQNIEKITPIEDDLNDDSEYFTIGLQCAQDDISKVIMVCSNTPLKRVQEYYLLVMGYPRALSTNLSYQEMPISRYSTIEESEIRKNTILHIDYEEKDLQALREQTEDHEESLLIDDIVKDEKETDRQFFIHMKSGDGKEPIKVSVNKNTPISFIKDYYLSTQGLPSSTKVQLLFDDESLNMSSKVGDTELDEDFLIDVVI
ncbi:hypothetical protein LJB42_001314 [Komagataella kurtzmanii]|nr:hypothetical protein LJB42_001314 [Komagataella kurtzmanii]